MGNGRKSWKSGTTIVVVLLGVALLLVFWWRLPEADLREPAREQPLREWSGASEPAAAPGPEGSEQRPGSGPGPAATTFVPPDASPDRTAEDLPTVADILTGIGDLSAPGARQRATEQIRLVEEKRRDLAREEARLRGLPLRRELPDGTVQEITGFEDGRPVYFTTHNASAAISTGANVLRLSPFSLNGSGLTLGMWDGGAARASHQEFATGSRLTVKDGAAVVDHATHVAGTLAAVGASASARGMATAALIDSYDWNQDKSEMTSRAAAAPAEPGMLPISNHSYGIVSGWNRVYGTGSPARAWEWWGDGTSASGYEQDFGRYNSYARDSDAIAFSAPYFLMFRSAGNEGNDNPAPGETVALAPGDSSVVAYNASLHPQGDGAYRGGYETIGFDAVAKNLITVGSVTDAVRNGVRDHAVASLSPFSSNGPTDDGRIKPDLVANGDELVSSLGGSNTAYGSFSGTSMSSPNAAGTAALMLQEYARLFPAGGMRSSTVRGLLAHTADDLGNAGPDYRYGWGLLNGVAAVNLIRDHAANPLKIRLNEDQLTTAIPARTHEFVWDGVSPIRVTLCWTDPAGAATNTNDLRTPRLVNNLDLRLVAPDGSEHLPWTMPFVGTWTQASMALPAVKGTNQTDNIERVDLAAPPAAGVYRCIVSHRGTLTNSQQHYSLIVSGSANQAPPPPPLAIEGVTPAAALPGPATIEITGTGFAEGMSVALVREGQPDRNAHTVTVTSPTRATVEFNLAGAAVGIWNLRAIKGGETALRTDAFTVLGAIWSEAFDGTLSGWTSQSATGSNTWGTVSTLSHSAPSSAFATAPAGKTTTHLQGPAIDVPVNASNLQLKFWHRYELQSLQDGGRIEFSVNEGTWFSIDSAGSGLVFASNGYTGTISNTGRQSNRSEFTGRNAWTGSSSGFIETIVNFTDNAKFSGKTLRVRWTLATNATTASSGWWIDTIALTGGGDLANQAPVITGPAITDSSETFIDPDDGTVHAIVRGSSVGLSVAADDDGGEASLIYTWTGIRKDGGEAPSFEINDSNAAKSTRAWFESAGDYLFTATASDAQGLAAGSAVNVQVLATPSALSVDPPAATLTVGSQQSFTAAVLDQFGDPIPGEPGGILWSAGGGGSISAEGVYSATVAGGPFGVAAAKDGLSGLAQITVNPAPAEVLFGGLARTFDGAPKPVEVETVPAGLSVTVTYEGSPDPPSAIGSYTVEAVVNDPSYQGSASGVLTIEARLFTGFADWTDFHQLTGAEASPGADSDADDLPNLLEYALGTDPGSHTPPFTAAIESDGSEPPVDRLTLRLLRPVNTPGVALRYWAGSDLTAWQEITTVETVPGPEENWQTVIVRDPEPATVPRRFLRVEAIPLP